MNIKATFWVPVYELCWSILIKKYKLAQWDTLKILLILMLGDTFLI